MVQLEASSIGDRRTAEIHRQVKLESNSVSEVAGGSNHRIDRLEDGPYPTTPDVNESYP